ncbi:MAG: tetraacyldisaccharide 4'-kinase [Thermoplasmata archaeon]|nr:tetraacyldisaccharide 4'-kinase [Thermoplasmata archaeon]
MGRKRVIIMGAAGRDFHNFNVFFRNNPEYEVVAFTATQIPFIENRRYPPELAGDLYPEGIPIYPEEELPRLVREHNVDVVVFAYSDVSHEYVMNRASTALAAGADFWLLGPRSTMLKSSKPVISVGAVRTGAGKSPTSRRVASILKSRGLRVVVVRHPMPYGDLAKQAVQRFASMEDLDRYGVTIEEREEYEPHLAMGNVVYAGVDYERILREAEREADVILWDGGNNDFPFFESDLHIVVADPLRAGHERRYHPGEANLRMADVVIISKVDSAPMENVLRVLRSVRELNPRARIIRAAMPITVEDPGAIEGKKVVAVEDGPTLTHGEMSFGAAVVASRLHGGILVDPTPYFVGTLRDALRKYPQIKNYVPALGYSEEQIRDLRETLNSVPADLIVSATPVDLTRLMELNKPVVRVRYEIQEIGRPTLEDVIEEFLREKGLA